MNQQTHFNSLKSQLEALVSTVDDGLDITSPDLTNIETHTENTATNTADIVTNTADTVANTADIVTNTTAVYNCIDHINNHIEVDTNAINGVTMAVNTGNNSDGTQRVTIANDDTVKNPIKVMSAFGAPNLYVGNTTNCQVIGAVRNDASAVVGGTDACFTPLSVDQSGRLYIDLKRIGGTAVSVNSGNKDAGCIRVCGATDDVNLTKLGVLTNCQITSATTNRSLGVVSRPISETGYCALGIGLGRQDWTSAGTFGYNSFITTGSGNISAVPTYTGTGDTNDSYGCPRVCIATDDVNISDMKAKINSIYTILNDVYDAGSHYLKTHAV